MDLGSGDGGKAGAAVGIAIYTGWRADGLLGIFGERGVEDL